MPEFAKNKPLTPREAITTVCREVDKLVDKGACEKCALKLVSHDLGLDYGKTLLLYIERCVDEPSE